MVVRIKTNSKLNIFEPNLEDVLSVQHEIFFFSTSIYSFLPFKEKCQFLSNVVNYLDSFIFSLCPLDSLFCAL